jgi:hypothetical protein
MAVNDNQNPHCGLIETLVNGQRRWAIAEYDRLGPVLRLGPFCQYAWAREKLADFAAMRQLQFDLALDREGGT